jgi:hypothetical protein
MGSYVWKNPFQHGSKAPKLGRPRSSYFFFKQETEVFSVFRSDFPFFLALQWAATSAKNQFSTGLKRQSWGSQRIPIVQNRKLGFSMCSEASSFTF